MKLLLIMTLFWSSFSASADMATDIDIEQSFIRAAIKQQRNSAVYMTIINQGKAASIVSAKSPAAKIVELHTHIHDKGIMRMRKIKQIELPPGKIVQLKPGGLHIMLLGLNRDLKPGDQIDVTLAFDDGSEKVFPVHVQRRLVPTRKDVKARKMDGRLPRLMTH